jgi:hypothetical protein
VNFHRHVAIEAAVARKPHLGHAAATKPALETESARDELLAREVYPTVGAGIEADSCERASSDLVGSDVAHRRPAGR